MSESRQANLLAALVAVAEEAMAALKCAKRGDVGATRRAIRGLALRLACAARVAEEAELAEAIERDLYVTYGLAR